MQSFTDEKHILFMGEIYPKEKKAEILGKTTGTMQIAADEFQWNLISGIEENAGKSVDILNMLPVNSYPRWYKDWYVKEEHFSHSANSNDVSIGYLNLTKIKYIFKNVHILPYLRKWICGKEHSPIWVINYTLNNGFLKGSKYIKHKNPKSKICVVIADLPEMSNLSSTVGSWIKIFNKIRFRRTKRLLSCVDCFVVLADQMVDYLHIVKPYCVIEGIAKEEVKRFDKRVDTDKRIIVYTGTLHECFGVKTLVDAFIDISNPNYKLVICGIGDSEEYIKKRAKEDIRINYLGQVSHDDVLLIQHTADVLVNPRQNIGEFTKYSFPSKTMESLSSGKPVIAYKLDGIPDEYDPYLFYVQNNSVAALTQKLTEVCEMKAEDRIKAGEAGKKFVLEQKNAVVQTRKILQMFEQCELLEEKHR